MRFLGLIFLLIAFAFGGVLESDFIKIDRDSLKITDETKFAGYIKSLDDKGLTESYKEILKPINVINDEEGKLTDVYSYEQAFSNLRGIYAKLYLKDRVENIDRVTASIKSRQAKLVTVLLGSQTKNLYDTDIIPIILEYRKLDRKALELSIQRENLVAVKEGLVDAIVKKKLVFENDDVDLRSKIKREANLMDELSKEAASTKNNIMLERIALEASISSIRGKSYEIKADFYEKIRLIKNIKSKTDAKEDKKKLDSLLGKTYKIKEFPNLAVNQKNSELHGEYLKQKAAFDALLAENGLNAMVFETVFKNFDGSITTKTGTFVEDATAAVLKVWNHSLFVVNNSDIQVKSILLVLFAAALVYLAAGWLNKKVIPAYFERKYKDTKIDHIRFITTKTVTVISYIVIFFVILTGLGLNLTNFAIIVSALSVGIGFGLQGVISNFVSGVILLFENSIKIGDVLSLPNGQTGVVTSVNLRTTNIKTADEITILIPNSTIFAGQIENLTKDSSMIRKKIKFSVGYSTDLEMLKALLDEKTADMLGKEMLEPPVLTVVGYGNYGIDIEYRIFVDIKKTPLGTEDFLKAFLTILEQNKIELPYPKLEIVKFESSLINSQISGKAVN